MGLYQHESSQAPEHREDKTLSHLHVKRNLRGSVTGIEFELRLIHEKASDPCAYRHTACGDTL